MIIIITQNIKASITRQSMQEIQDMIFSLTELIKQVNNHRMRRKKKKRNKTTKEREATVVVQEKRR